MVERTEGLHEKHIRLTVRAPGMAPGGRRGSERSEHGFRQSPAAKKDEASFWPEEGNSSTAGLQTISIDRFCRGRGRRPTGLCEQAVSEVLCWELDFSEEVVGRCLQPTEEGDVEVVPSMFKLSFFEVDVDEPDREVQL